MSMVQMQQVKRTLAHAVIATACVAGVIAGGRLLAQGTAPTLPPPPPPAVGEAVPPPPPVEAAVPAPASNSVQPPVAADAGAPPPVAVDAGALPPVAVDAGAPPAGAPASTPGKSKSKSKPERRIPDAKAFKDKAKTEPFIPAGEKLPAESNVAKDVSGDMSGNMSGNMSGLGAAPKPEGKRGSETIPAGQELINIDFPEPTEIKDIIKAVALWTNKNVILDRNVSGKVQIISPRKVTKEEAYQAFLSALNLLGMTTVETGKIIKIMPVRTAVKDNLKTFLGSTYTQLTDEIITQIVPLKYIDAKEIQNTLSRIVSSNSMIAYEKTNTLIISDTGYKVRRILDILGLLDVQGQQPQVSIVPIRYADAKSIVDKINELMKAGAGRGTPAYKLLTDDRTNAVIIFGPPRTISDVKNLVKKFDTPLTDPQTQSTIHVRPLDYADAKKLSSTLSNLAQGKSGGGGGLRRMNPLRPAPSSAPGIPSGGGGGGDSPVAELDEGTKITADEQSNSLLITGSRASYNAINSIVRKLDIRRSQVFVEADILDINMNNQFNFGTNFLGGQGGAGKTNILHAWQAGPLAPLVVGGASPTAAAAAAAAAPFAEDMTIGILAGNSVEVPGLGTVTPGAMIKLIKTDSNTRILSSPHILTANNEEAKITVGEKIFFKSSEFNAQTGVAIPKIEKEDVDLVLGLKPNISNTNFITMKVDLESASVTLDAGTGLPRISKRKTSQVLTVKNMQTVVVSGLVKSTELETFKKIPLLGDIPILGWLFRNSYTQTLRNNLLIFLTPHIIHGADDLAAIYQRKIKERDEFMEQVYGSRFKKDDFYALLPTKSDGEHHPDESEKREKERREQARLDAAGGENTVNGTAGEAAENANDAADGNDTGQSDSVPVPFIGSSSGSASGGGDNSGGSPLPPPPPPPPPPGPNGGFGGDGGSFDAPPPEPPPPME